MRSAARHGRLSGSSRPGSLFFTLPTRVLTGQQIIPSEGYGASKDFSCVGSAGSSPSHAGQASGARTTGIRLWSWAQSSFGSVVTSVKAELAGLRVETALWDRPS